METRPENPAQNPRETFKRKLMQHKAKKKAELEELMQRMQQYRSRTEAAKVDEEQSQNGENAEVEEMSTEDSGKVERSNEELQTARRVTGSAEITAVSQNAEPVKEESFVATSEMEKLEAESSWSSHLYDLTNGDGDIDDAKTGIILRDKSVQTFPDFWWDEWAWTDCCNCCDGFSGRCSYIDRRGCEGRCCCSEERHVVRLNENDPRITNDGGAAVSSDYEALLPLATYFGSTSLRIREKPLSPRKKFRSGSKRACGEFRSLPWRGLKEHRCLRRALSGQRAWREEARGSSSQSSLATVPKETLSERLVRATNCVERANKGTECVSSSYPVAALRSHHAHPNTTKLQTLPSNAVEHRYRAMVRRRENRNDYRKRASVRNGKTERSELRKHPIETAGEVEGSAVTPSPMKRLISELLSRNRSSESPQEHRHRHNVLSQRKKRPRPGLRRYHLSAIFLRGQRAWREKDCLGRFRSSLAPGRGRRADHYLKLDAERRDDRECVSTSGVPATPKRCSFRRDDVQMAADDVQAPGQDAERDPARDTEVDAFERNVQRLRGGGSDVDEFNGAREHKASRRHDAINDSQCDEDDDDDDRDGAGKCRSPAAGKRMETETKYFESFTTAFPERRSRTLRFYDERREDDFSQRQEDSDFSRIRGGCGRSSKYHASDPRYGLQTKRSRKQLHYQACPLPPPPCPPSFYHPPECRPAPCCPPPCPPPPCCLPPPCPPPPCCPPPCPPPLCRPPPCPPIQCLPPPCAVPPCQRLTFPRQRHPSAKGCCSCGGCGGSLCTNNVSCDGGNTECCSTSKKGAQCCKCRCQRCKDVHPCGVCGSQSCGRMYSCAGSAGGTCCFPRNTRKRSGSECCGSGNSGCGGCC